MFIKKSIIVSSILIIGSSLIARDKVLNEDVQFIIDWHRQQQAEQLATQLQLSPQQIQELKTIKADVERIRSESETRSQALKEELEALAKLGRTQIERNGSLSPETQNALKAVRRERKRLRTETKLKMQLATLGLRDVLQADQIAVIRASQKKRPSGERAKGEQKRRFARFVLSDAFLSQWEQ